MPSAVCARSRPQAFDGKWAVSDWVRAQSLHGLEQVIGKYGGDAAEIACRFDINLDMCRQPSQRIPCSSYLSLLEHCAVSLDAPFFGMELAQHQSIDMFGCLAQLMLSGDSVRHALEALVTHLSAYNGPTTLVSLLEGSTLGMDGDLVEVTHINRLQSFSRKRQVLEWGGGLLLKIMRALAGPEFRPTYVRLATNSPPVSPRRMEEIFGCPVYYEEEISAIVFPAAVLDWKLPPRGSGNDLGDVGLSDELPIEDRVDEVILRLLVHNECAIDSCARQLGLTRRTLQMKLTERGYDFSRLLAHRRLLLAQDFLRDSKMPLGEIANVLCYADQSTFTRAFTRWSGQSPAKYRSVASHKPPGTS